MKPKLILLLSFVLFAGSMLNSCKKSTDNNPVMFLNIVLVMPSIMQFSVSYAKGVEYFDSLYHKNVQTRGYYASSFP
ncbi:MAG: hypothetical protein WCI48_03325 [Bacteroidota bacterium]|jgi:hypothetical protein